MSRPLPICATSTPDAREAFLRVIWCGGMEWCGVGQNAHPNDQENLIRDARQSDQWTHCMAVDAKVVMFITPPDARYRIKGGEGTLVNSPAHLVRYVKTLGI